MAVVSTAVILAPDTRANQPAANTVGIGAIYYVTDEHVLERSTGLAWEAFSVSDAEVEAIVAAAPPAAHATSHEEGESDELDVLALGGYSGDAADVLAGNGSWKDAAAQTADLDEMVGDSGSGGTKGLVPAPAAGDAAADKYLKADGTWDEPPGTGSGITELTGDVTAGPGTGSQVASIAASGVTPDTYGDATNIPQLTIGADGRITSAVDIPIVPGAAWELAASSSPSGVNTVTFADLGDYTDIRVLILGITMTAVSTAEVQVSTNNGSSFLSASGDYLGISGAGVATNMTRLAPYVTDATAARYGELLIEGFNLAAPKVARSNFYSQDSVNLRIIPTTTALNALRVFTVSGTNFTGGTIYVFGRR